MNPWVTRIDAWSAAGRGVGPLIDALSAARPLGMAVRYAVSGLRSPFAAQTGARSASELLEAVLGAIRPTEGDCGLVVATSSGDISGPFERWNAARREGAPGPEAPWRQAPTLAAAARFGLAPHTTVSVACASGAAAFAIARGWLRDGVCSRVLVAGVDLLSLYIHAGFAGLGAIAGEQCRSFQANRDGLMLGEGAAAMLLETPAAARAGGRTALTTLRGVGLSQDAVHITAPDRQGLGLYRAASAALRDAGVEAGAIEAVSAHGTGTQFNDAMEAQALARLFRDPVPLHAAKPVIGHTLGAAGTLEAVALIAMLGGADCPAPPGPVAEDCPVRFRPARDPRLGLSVNAAFGGVNAALVFGPADEVPAGPRQAARALATAQIDADSLPLSGLPGAPPSLGRADSYVRAGIAALARLGPLDPGCAVVLSSTTGCRAADLRYHETLLRGGPGAASRTHFIYTIPGSPLAEASILLGLRGPGLVLCDGAERGEIEARGLVARGEVPQAVALHVEAPEQHATASATLFGVRSQSQVPG